MMRTLGLWGAIALLAIPASAEVSVSITASGSALRLNVSSAATPGAVWSKLSDLPDRLVLNRHGDRQGDLGPSCGIIWVPMDDPRQGASGGTKATSPVASALVVWSRHDGEDYELVYSLWDPFTQTWQAASFVDRRDNETDDVDPSLVVRDAVAYVTWRSADSLLPALLVKGTLVRVGGTPQMLWDEPMPLSASTVVDGLDYHALTGGQSMILPPGGAGL